MKNNIIKLAVIASATMLAACGGSNDNSPKLANFSLGVSDAPVNGALSVMVCFNKVELTGNGLGKQSFTIGSDTEAAAANDKCRDANGNVIANSRGIDLLLLDGAKSEALISGAKFAAGNYGQLRLAIAEGSYVVQEDGLKVPLRVPSNELKLGGVTLSAGGTFNYTLEFDLRKAMVNPVGQPGYLLKPRGLRLVDNSEIGHLTGQVAEGLLINNSCTVAPVDVLRPVATVYLYQGADRPLAELSDNGGVNVYQSYASTNVYFDGVSEYHYSIGYIDADTYTAAVSCDIIDDPEQADDITFLQAENVIINANATPVQLDFTP
ncbi:DUF4382 domain-containing protein [Rheinheimera salexigens]|uniref:DUF4382 domain-containing protein n=1 Tax=Rheinheimera salexigens TaxID=1628148 RepID=A0A1E7Q6X4_9GAMM|nr:DUF4382 domain-containing protein [Rheinheimera salexigens]OEY69823.1 hypothetical protein BI198_09805 [Rheinheimera salexigens]